MKNIPLTDEQIDAAIKAFEKALGDDVWQSSAFLRVMGKKLAKIQERFLTEVDAKRIKEQTSDNEQVTAKVRDSAQVEVFVLLYSNEGSNLRTWEQIIINLPRQVVSRPIYEKEEDIQRAIREKKNYANHAYAVVYTNPSDILVLPDDRKPRDKYDVPLIMLKDKSLKIGQIARFVHGEKIYAYSRGRLIKTFDPEAE